MIEPQVTSRSCLSRRDVLAVFVGALALRAALLVTTADDPVFATPMLDAEYAVEWARLVLEQGIWASPEGTAYFRTPLYAWFLAFSFWLPGPDLLMARALQALLGAATCVLLAGLAARRLGRIAGLATGTLSAVSWPLLLFGRELLIAGLVPFLGAVILWLVDDAARRPSVAPWLAVGIAVGAAALARPTFLAAAPVALLAATGIGANRRARRLAAVAIGVAAMLLPITVRNRVVSGDWVVLSYQGGLNLWIGNNPEADGTSARLPGLTSWRNEDVEALLAREFGRRVGPAEQDAYYRERALRFFADEPVSAAALFAKKMYLLLQGYEIRNNRDLYALRERDPILRLPWPDFGWILPLAIAGMFATWPRRRDFLDWYGWTLLSAASVVLFFVCARYRIIVWPALLLFAGAGVAWLTHRGSGAFRLGGRVVILAALVVLARVDFLKIRNPDPSQIHFQYGNVYARTGDPAAAEHEFREALRLAPGYGQARHHLGALLVTEGRASEALPELRAAAAASPQSFRARRTLAQALERLGAVDEALQVRQEAAELSAGRSEDRLALADALGRTGRYAEAWNLYESLLSEASGEEADPFLLLNAGQTALTLGREEAGLGLLQRATRGADIGAEAYEAMARYWMSKRAPKDAHRVLSEAILRHPENAELHRLRALARYATGDRTGTEEDLARAVALDPTDEESRRRLAEIRSGEGPR